MRQKFVMGNWKMNGSVPTTTALLTDLLNSLPTKRSASVVVIPPSIYLPLAQSLIGEHHIGIGAQNVYPKDAGAFTGELSAPMLNDYGCQYVLVGHSERRNLFHEDEKFVAEKFHHVKEHGMIPVLCVGETLAERENGLTEAVLTKQLLAVTGDSTRVFQQCVIAYEPVWAIGTGKTATPEQAEAVHVFIRHFVAKVNEQDADRLSIVYGGSVNEKNAATLFAMPNVDGGLVGGASLNAQQFVEIVKCIN